MTDPHAESVTDERDDVVGAPGAPVTQPSADAVTEAEDVEPGPAAPAPDEQPQETLDVPLADLRPALEAVLMVADQPLDSRTLASAVGYPVDQVEEALGALTTEYADQGRGFDLRHVAGGWRYYTREDYASVVEQFVLEGQQARLTQAALETLAVVAYKQPVSRARVSAIRGVNVDGVMRTLVSRGLIEEAGHDAETTAVLYRTTGYFLERIGVTSIEELPELAPFLPGLGEMDDPDEAREVPAEAGPEAGHEGSPAVEAPPAAGEGFETDSSGAREAGRA